MSSAKESGVENIVVPSVDLESAKRALEIAEIYGNVYVAAGIHPTKDLEKLDLGKTLYLLEENASLSKKVVAIGEIGLDYFRYKSPSRIQRKYFEEQLKLAAKLGKAVIIHNRQAGQDIISCIESVGVASFRGKIVFHCCPPEDLLLEYAIKNSIYLGVDGDVTYDNQKQEFVKSIPLELLVLETDSPFLIPEPLRSQKVFPNEPKYLNLVAEKVADLKDVEEEYIIEVTTENAKRLFEI